jgi:hypothetical protein
LLDQIEKLEKKLKEIKTLSVDKPKSLDNLPMPKPQNNDPKPKGIEAPKAGENASKKDPKKVAEQLKNSDAKKMKMDSIKSGAEMLKFDKNGQWALEKAKYTTPEQQKRNRQKASDRANTDAKAEAGIEDKPKSKPTHTPQEYWEHAHKVVSAEKGDPSSSHYKELQDHDTYMDHVSDLHDHLMTENKPIPGATASHLKVVKADSEPLS